ncbi:MAG: hypothetical protein RMJ56_18095 [Gemmataceae bacterium]|nr:hypothetical protein [Gemmata sp.]MDW8199508.1 hypothetical protein [Gemmataceae bacterium]
MMARSILGLLVLFAVLGCYGSIEQRSAEESEPPTYSLRVRVPGEGAVLHGAAAIDLTVTVHDQSHDAAAATDPQSAKTYVIREEIRYRETIEAFPAGAKRPTRARVVFTQWHKEHPFAGPSTTEPLPRVVGREIVIQKLNGWYDIFATDGHPIDPHLRLFIDQRYSDFHEAFTTHDMVPPQPVRVGESWPIPVMKWTRWLDQLAFLSLDDQQSHGFARLVSIFERNNRQYARLAVATHLVPHKTARTVPGSSPPLDVHWDVTLCVDGTWHDVEAVARVQMATAPLDPDEPPTGTHVRGTVSWTETEERGEPTAVRSSGAKVPSMLPEVTPSRAEEIVPSIPVAQPPPPFPKN